jgi:hypothetical protein
MTERGLLQFAALILLPASFAFGQGGKKASTTTAASPAAPAQPAGSASSPATSSATIESQMLAAGGLDKIADAIATNVCTKLPDKTGGASPTSTVVIFDQASFASIQSYEAFIANASAIVSLYASLLPDDSKDLAIPDKKKLNALLKQQYSAKHSTLLPRGIGISSTIDPFSDATAVLSAIAIGSNTETPGSIVFPDSSMAVALTGSLTSSTGGCLSKDLAVAYPPLFGSGSASDYSSADIQSDLDIVNEVRGYVTTAVQATNNDWITKHTPSTGVAPATGDPVLTAALTDVTTQYDNYIGPYLQLSSNGTSTGIGPVVQGYQLANLLAGKADAAGQHPHPAYILLATVVSAGGTMRDHKSFWTALGNGDKITFSGGLIVSVAMWQSNGNAPVLSKVLRFRAPFSDVQSPSNTDTTHVTDGDKLK